MPANPDSAPAGTEALPSPPHAGQDPRMDVSIDAKNVRGSMKCFTLWKRPAGLNWTAIL